MNNSNSATNVGTANINPSEVQSEMKGKGKAVDYTSQEMSLDEEEDSSDEDDGLEEEVTLPSIHHFWSNTHFYPACRTR